MAPVSTRVILTISTILVTTAVTLAFFGGPEIGSAYLHTTGFEGKELPRLTDEFSLPLLRIESSSAHDRPVTTLWSGIVWAILIIGPTSIAWWSSKAGSPEAIVSKWATGSLVYLHLVLLLLVSVSIGLVLPFACLKGPI